MIAEAGLDADGMVKAAMEALGRWNASVKEVRA